MSYAEHFELQTIERKKNIAMEKRNVFVLIIIVLFSISCEKENIVEVFKTHKWNNHPAFQYDNSILLNSFSVDSSYMVISGTDFFSKVGDVANLGGYDSIFEDDFIKQKNIAIKPVSRKIPITSQITVTYKETGSSAAQVNFISTANYGSAASYSTTLKMEEVDPTFSGFNFERAAWNDCIAINENGQVLIPYYSRSNEVVQLRLLLVNTQQTGSSMLPTEILDTKIIKIEDEYEYHVNYLQSSNELFFVTTDSKTYRIDTEGNLTDKFDDFHLYDMVQRNDTLYAFGYDFTLGQNEFLHSTNNGKIWNKTSTSEFEIAHLNLTTIEDKTIGYWRSQIWQVMFSDSGYSVVELDNDGLAGEIITSITAYKNKVYATTRSGLFYRNLSNLFEIKEAGSN